MGLFTGLLLLPLAPVRGVAWVSNVLVEAAEQELCDPQAIRARLAALNRDYEDGLIGDGDFEREEERLLDLLDRSRAMSAKSPARERTRDNGQFL